MLAKFYLNLTLPAISEVTKLMSKNISGRFFYKNIRLNINFTEANEELDIKIRVPLRLKIQKFSFLNKNPCETQNVIIEV